MRFKWDIIQDSWATMVATQDDTQFEIVQHSWTIILEINLIEDLQSVPQEWDLLKKAPEFQNMIEDDRWFTIGTLVEIEIAQVAERYLKTANRLRSYRILSVSSSWSSETANNWRCSKSSELSCKEAMEDHFYCFLKHVLKVLRRCFNIHACHV